MDYVLYRVLPDTTAVRLTDIEEHDDLELTNYFFAPANETAIVDDAVGPNER
jgi:hypothetical protein